VEDSKPLDTKPDIKPDVNKEHPSTSSTFLCVVAPAEQVLITEAPITGTLSLVPTSMNSKTHLELAKHVGNQHVKHSRMKVLVDNDETKVLIRKAAGFDGIALNPLGGEKKRGGRGVKKGKKLESSDEEEGNYGTAQTRRAGIKGRARNDKDEEEEEDDGFIVDDSDDEKEKGGSSGSDYGGKKKKGKSGKKRKGEVEELDEMEEAERRIEEREREKKRARRDRDKGGKKKSRDYVDTDEEEGGEDMDMDVESEDD
jgi:RNA polymerase-associated protein LEO1